MLKKFWAFITADSVADQAEGYRTNGNFSRFLYTPQMLEEINEGRRYQLLANNAQTEIYIIDKQYRQRVARLYDISYALIVADALNAAAEGQ